MGLFDFLKTKKTGAGIASGSSYFETNISDEDLKTLIDKAISVFQDYPEADHNQIIDTIKTYRDEEDLALALYRFIPIAFCRVFIPEPSYSNEYVVFKSESDQQTYPLSADRIYQQVDAGVRKRFAAEGEQEKLLPILYHSADFQAINKALNNGSDLKDLVCGPAVFLAA